MRILLIKRIQINWCYSWMSLARRKIYDALLHFFECSNECSFEYNISHKHRKNFKVIYGKKQKPSKFIAAARMAVEHGIKWTPEISNTMSIHRPSWAPTPWIHAKQIRQKEAIWYANDVRRKSKNMFLSLYLRISSSMNKATVVCKSNFVTKKQIYACRWKK